MAALHIAMLAALTDRRKSVVAANALYGATVSLLMKVLEPLGRATCGSWISAISTRCARRSRRRKPGCMLMETISNPLLRVGADRPDRRDRARGRRGAGGGQHVRHAAARAAAGTGRAFQRAQRHQVSGGARRRAGRRRWSPTRSIYETLRTLSRAIGPVLGPFESYLTMRGIKTFPLRMERQCANACRVARG